ncbi:hypothetical protein G7046_g3381 [Stylonectria norvegica]|nr:hypothetical protein G7046_g3381 [Stylonectria norvegica]
MAVARAMAEESNRENKPGVESQHMELSEHDAEHGKQDCLEPGSMAFIIAQMTSTHKEYILQRHGTLEIDPMPSEDPNDPHNWPRWQSLTNLFLLSFHALMIGFMTGGPISAFQAFSNEFNVSLNAASYTVSSQILILGVAPLFWCPLSQRFGRRPVWLASTLLSMASNIGCACSHTYGQMMVARIFQAFFNSPAGAIGAAVVVELFFSKERAQKLGVWTLMVTIGNPLGPLLMGFVATRVGWRWIFWIFTMINGLQFLGYLLFSPESRYVRDAVYGPSVDNQKTSSISWQKYFKFGRIPGSTPLTFYDFWAPIALLRNISVSTSVLSHSIVFAFCSVLVCIEIPALLGVKFGLDFESIGLNFIPLVIGNIIGELVVGTLSDWIRNRGSKNRVPPAEQRLWLSYPALVLCIAGLTTFLVTLGKSRPGQWNVHPDIGLGITAAGNQMFTTVLFTYAVEKNLDRSGEVGVVIIMIRQIWSFIGPFWFPLMFTSLGMGGSAALCSGIIVIFAGVVTITQQLWLGSKYQ